jgi:hypothetical protein
MQLPTGSFYEISKKSYFAIIYNVIFLIIVGGNKLEYYVDGKRRIDSLVHYKHRVIVDAWESEKEWCQGTVID